MYNVRGEGKREEGGCCNKGNLLLLSLGLNPVPALGFFFFFLCQDVAVEGRKRDIKHGLSSVLNVKERISRSGCCVQMKTKS